MDREGGGPSNSFKNATQDSANEVEHPCSTNSGMVGVWTVIWGCAPSFLARSFSKSVRSLGLIPMREFMVGVELLLLFNWVWLRRNGVGMDRHRDCWR